MTDASSLDWDDFPPFGAPRPFEPWTGLSIGRPQVDALLADVGTTFEILIQAGSPSRRVTSWTECVLVKQHGATYITADVVYESNGRSGDLGQAEIEIRDGRARLTAWNGRETTGTPYNDEALVLWRVEHEDGHGPFRLGQALRDMNAAMTGDPEVCWHQANMTTALDEDLDQTHSMRAAVACRRDLVRWFPRRARLALAPHGYRVVRLLVAAGSAQIGTTQAIYNPAYATRLDG